MIYENEAHWFEVQEKTSDRIEVAEDGRKSIVEERSFEIYAWHKTETGSYQEAVYNSKEKVIHSFNLSCLTDLLPIFMAIEEARVDETDLILVPDGR